MAGSEVARFREQQVLQEEAMQRALYAPAITASHAFITARMQIAAERLLCLIQEGKHEEVIQLMATPTWGLEEAETCHIAAVSGSQPPRDSAEVSS